MEFQSGEVTAFFTLTIAERESEIRIKDVLFGAVPADEHAATQTFARALAAARRDAGPANPRGMSRRPASAQVRTFAGRRVAPGATLSGAFTYSVIESDIGSDLGGRRATARNAACARGCARVSSPSGAAGPLPIAASADLTKTGARLQLDADLPLPKSFLLTEAGHAPRLSGDADLAGRPRRRRAARAERSDGASDGAGVIRFVLDPRYAL